MSARPGCGGKEECMDGTFLDLTPENLAAVMEELGF